MSWPRSPKNFLGDVPETVKNPGSLFESSWFCFGSCFLTGSLVAGLSFFREETFPLYLFCVWPLFLILLKSKTIKQFFLANLGYYTAAFLVSMEGLLNYLYVKIQAHFLLALASLLVLTLLFKAVFCLMLLPAFFLKDRLKLNHESSTVVFVVAVYFARHFDVGLFPMELTNLLGGFSHSYKQLLSIFGVTGLEFVFLLVNGIFACACLSATQRQPLKAVWQLVTVVLLLSGLQWLSLAEKDYWTDTEIRQIKFTLYQPGFVRNSERTIQQKYEDERFDLERVKTLLSDVENIESNDFVILPETFLFSNINQDEKSGTIILKQTARHLGVDIFSGGHSFHPPHKLNHNTLFLVNKEGKLVKEYFKYHLMPFGETKPFRYSLPEVSRLLPGNNLYERGPSLEEAIFNYGNYRVGLAICYEDISRDVFWNFAKNEVDLALIVSSDNQFSSEFFARNHMAGSHSMALAGRIPIIRSTTTGISSTQDHLGNTIFQTGHNTEELVTAILPVPEKSGKTFFYKYRMYHPWLALCGLVLAIAPACLPKKYRRT